MKPRTFLVLTAILLVHKVLIPASRAEELKDGPSLKERDSSGGGSPTDSGSEVPLAGPCDSNCDQEGGSCDSQGRCVCNPGRTGQDCSQVSEDNSSTFPDNPAAKLDIALSIIAAIVLLSMVLIAFIPLRRLTNKKTKREAFLGLNKEPNPEVVENARVY